MPKIRNLSFSKQTRPSTEGKKKSNSIPENNALRVINKFCLMCCGTGKALARPFYPTLMDDDRAKLKLINYLTIKLITIFL